MEQTANVNEPVTTDNQGNSEVKESQPTFEELAEQERQVGTQLSEVSEQLEETAAQDQNTELSPEIPGEVKVEMELVEAELKVEEPELTPEEKIIDAWLQNGKTEVTTNELIDVGFDGSELHPKENRIGRFRLHRIMIISPFQIEKVNQDTNV